MSMPPSLALTLTHADNVDPLGWTDGFVFEAFGARIGVHVNDRHLLPKLRDILPPFATIIPPTTADVLYSVWHSGVSDSLDQQFAPHRLDVDGEGLIETSAFDYLLDVLESTLNTGVAVLARTHLFMHAGVVSLNGQAILLPGRSMAGKTELVAALVQSGATYYSDEYAPIDKDGLVHPFPKPLYRRRAGQPLRDRCSPEMLGGCAGVDPLPVGLILLTEYQPGAVWQPRHLSGGEAMLRCVEHTPMARREPARMLVTLSRVIAGAETLSGEREEAADVVASIHAAVDHRLSR